MGQNRVIWDKVTDKMDYKSVEMSEIPGLISGLAMNPNRFENEGLKWQSYDGNHAIQREFIRKKKMQVKYQMLVDYQQQ